MGRSNVQHSSYFKDYLQMCVTSTRIYFSVAFKNESMVAILLLLRRNSIEKSLPGMFSRLSAMLKELYYVVYYMGHIADYRIAFN